MSWGSQLLRKIGGISEPVTPIPSIHYSMIANMMNILRAW
jgi:hypothetical protein